MKNLFYSVLFLMGTSSAFGQVVPIVIDHVEFINTSNSLYFLSSLMDKDYTTCTGFYAVPNDYQYDVPPDMSYTHNYVVNSAGQQMGQCDIAGVYFKEQSTGYTFGTLFCDGNGNFLYSGSKQVGAFVNGAWKYFVITWSIPSVVFQGTRSCLYGSGKASISVQEL